jgi:hypothetical protein
MEAFREYSCFLAAPPQRRWRTTAQPGQGMESVPRLRVAAFNLARATFSAGNHAAKQSEIEKEEKTC